MFRPPIVTILGHVDHGKTTLLDYIRKTNIAQKEYGGITQKIGAYEITTSFKDYKTNKITFIDTPGHEAFSMLRSRGANVADIAILLIDGKDSIMPQTIESISHIRNAKIPFIVAINKIDLSEANPEKIKNDLLKYEVIVEEKGGKIPVCLISAKTGKGVNELLETILFLSNDLNLTYDEKSPAEAYIIETKKDKRGIIASAIIKNGKIKLGDIIFNENNQIKIRSLLNDQGKIIKEVFPSMPFEILGFDKLPKVGSLITTINQNKKINYEKDNIINNQKLNENFSLETILKSPKEEEKKLSIIIKADSQGSLDAINESIKDINNIEIVLKSIGEITKSDIFLAKTTKSIVVGFGVRPNQEAEVTAEQEKIIIKTYKIIYELLDELTEVAILLKEKENREKNLKGEAKILATFIIENEKIFGVKITKGKINLNDPIEIYRENKLIGKTKLISLKHKSKNIIEAKKDMEAGMVFYPQLDIKVGDMIKSIL
ncbi:MAG: translation initiation factor IF-2 [Patescibacteria group bacterium]|nr:translation initiation factor IF-2 [Patescibacteria group bacterium]